VLRHQWHRRPTQGPAQYERPCQLSQAMRYGKCGIEHAGCLAIG
jgi:hypothetical protein